MTSRILLLCICVFLASCGSGGGEGFTTITATSPNPKATQLAIQSGDKQEARVGTAVAIRPSVRVTDSNGTPVAGVTVVFTPDAGFGTATGTTVLTNSSGIATVGSWTLGATAGANTLLVTSAALPGAEVYFIAKALP